VVSLSGCGGGRDVEVEVDVEEEMDERWGNGRAGSDMTGFKSLATSLASYLFAKAVGHGSLRH
jgi:hypothetical protein